MNYDLFAMFESCLIYSDWYDLYTSMNYMSKYLSIFLFNWHTWIIYAYYYRHVIMMLHGTLKDWFGNDFDYGMRMVDGYGKIDIFGNRFCVVESNSRRNQAKER